MVCICMLVWVKILVDNWGENSPLEMLKLKLYIYIKKIQTFFTEQSFVKRQKERVFIQGFYFIFVMSLRNELKIEMI